MWLISPAKRLPRFAPRLGNRRWHSRTFAPRHTTDQYDSQSVDAMLIIHCHLFLSSVDFYWLLICLSFWSSTCHCVFTSYASFWKPVFPAITIVTAFEFYHLRVASRKGSDLSLLHVLGIRTMCCLWLSIVYSVAWKFLLSLHHSTHHSIFHPSHIIPSNYIKSSTSKSHIVTHYQYAFSPILQPNRSLLGLRR